MINIFLLLKEITMEHPGLALWLFCCIFVPANFAMEKLTNIDNVGLGYDILLGNPHNDLQDPGFRENIFQLTYDQVKITPIITQRTGSQY